MPRPSVEAFREDRNRLIKFGGAGKHVLPGSNFICQLEWNHRATGRTAALFTLTRGDSPRPGRGCCCSWLPSWGPCGGLQGRRGWVFPSTRMSLNLFRIRAETPRKGQPSALGVLSPPFVGLGALGEGGENQLSLLLLAQASGFGHV